MTIIYIISTLLIGVGVFFILKLTPEQITKDLSGIISPELSFWERSKIAKGKKKVKKITVLFNNTRDALKATGRGKQFAIVCASSLLLFIVGFTLSIFINNLFLAPVAAVAMASIPFLYVKSTLEYYQKKVSEELDIALAMITNSYIRLNNLITAVEENIENIKPPIRYVFESFIFRVKYVSPSIKSALYDLKESIDNYVFREWCDCLIQCQDDHTLAVTLTPIVKKLTEIRIINNELNLLISEPKAQYKSMVAIVILNIPFMYVLNNDWFFILIGTIFGKFVLAITFLMILVTGFLMIKVTKPMEYKK